MRASWFIQFEVHRSDGQQSLEKKAWSDIGHSVAQGHA
jgi:hypothetical protein